MILDDEFEEDQKRTNDIVYVSLNFCQLGHDSLVQINAGRFVEQDQPPDRESWEHVTNTRRTRVADLSTEERES